jgi:hypothetical protein
MGKKEEFRKLIDEVLGEISQTKNKKGEICIGAEDTLYMLINLNQQIEEQRENVDKLSKQLKDLERNLNILIKELVSLGYIDMSERRKLFKRNLLSQEALTNLLVAKKVISRKELLNMIKLLKTSQSKT